MATGECVYASVYTSAACNRSPHCLDWGKNNLIIYGACHAVIVYKTQGKGGGSVLHTLVGHKKTVTSVHWIRRRKVEENEFVSTSSDHTAVIWTSNKDKAYLPTTLRGHTNAVQTASGVYLDNDGKSLLLATASADSTIKIWKRIENEVDCIQDISFGLGFATSITMTLLEDLPDFKDPLLAAATDDYKVRLYGYNEEDKFLPLVTLGGHEDWIHGLDFAFEQGDLLLSTGSQDCFIRIWRIADAAKLKENATDSDSLKLKERVLKTPRGKEHHVTLESVIHAHENWIYSVRWLVRGKYSKRSLRLLSTSMDKSMVIWEFDSTCNLWLDKVRVGEIGGNTLGFFGGVYSPREHSIIAHGYQGAIHIWWYNEQLDYWEPGVPFGGHFAPVHDIAWDPEGAYLMSCSQDQTTRLHAPWGRLEEKGMWLVYNWSELARPQVHGYDMVCLAILNRFKFISGADEKILRVFEAPRSFAENLMTLCNVDTCSYLMDTLPEGASVPTLGLSNKAVFESDIVKAEMEKDEPKHAKDIYPTFNYTPVVLKEPPTEELLLQNTLWPEVQKLYGHPYEVFAVATNHQGTLIASACKASKLEHAAIILWDAATQKDIGQLLFHALTITQIEFSPNDQFLLSVSRDRTWAIYRHFPDESPPYRKIANSEKKSSIHTRIIWSCSWSHDSLYFATASRDKKVALWGKQVTDNDDITFVLATTLLEVEDSATAVAFAPCSLKNERYIIAIGLENGKILVYAWTNLESSSEKWHLHFMLDKNCAHHLTVNRMKFSPLSMTPKNTEEEISELLLASCGSDHFVRIYSFAISSFDSSSLYFIVQ